MAIATEVGNSPASVYSILTNSLGKQKVCAKWIPHMPNDDQRTMCVLLATICSVGEMKAIHSFKHLMRDGCIHLTLS
jgi:hypothetical protein